MIQTSEGVHRGETYWYMLYQIENRTGKDRDAFVSISAKSNKGKTYASVWLPDVEELIERRMGKLLWGKNDEVALLKERAEKKEIKAEKGTFNYITHKAGKPIDCVAIFNKLDPGATSITITMDGLSNDLNLIQKENGSRQIESRIFVVDLERPGDEYEMNLDRFQIVKSGWSKKITEVAQVKEKDGAGKKAAPKEKSRGTGPREGAACPQASRRRKTGIVRSVDPHKAFFRALGPEEDQLLVLREFLYEGEMERRCSGTCGTGGTGSPTSSS